MTLVLSLFRGEIEVAPPKPTMREIACLVAECHGLTLEDLRKSDSSRKYAHPRQEAMSLIYSERRYSNAQIGRFFNCHHTTVIYARKAVQARLERARRAA